MHSRFPSLLLAAALLTACGGDNGTDSPNCTISAVSLPGAPTAMLVGASVTLNASVTQTNCTAVSVAWSTSNAAVATVSNLGVVTAVGAGNVTITASSGGKSANAPITVTLAPVASVLMTPDSMIVTPGTSFLFAATPQDAGGAPLSGRAIAWASTNQASATVSGSGLLAALLEGTTTTITATSEGQVGNAKVWVVRPRVGYLWNHDPNPTVPFEPTTSYSFTTLPGAFQVSKLATGQYTVGYPQLTRATRETEALFITAYQTPDGNHCRIDGWSAGSGNVSCFDATGAAADSRFTFTLLGSASLGHRFGYAWINDATSATSVAHTSYRYSSSGLPITVTHPADGQYVVRFTGLGRANANDLDGALVSAYGSGAAIHCQLGGSTSTGGHLDVDVRCFNAAGDPANSSFDIALVSQPRTGAKIGFADADQPAAATYTPTTSAVKPTGTVTVIRSAPGSYNVTFAGLGRSPNATETFHVVAVGTSARRCHVVNWQGDAGQTTVSIVCSNAAGFRTDSRFVVVGLQ